MSNSHRQVRKAVVLLSGGIDSATTLAVAARDGFSVSALSFNYGQRHVVELDAARRIARQFNVADHLLMDINLRVIGGSALTADISVPKHRSVEHWKKDIPVTYVPARNTIFLSYALAWTESLGLADIFIGVNALDYSGYPDCRPEYIEAFERLANLATKASVEGTVRFKIHTPLIDLSKAQIISLGIKLGVDFSLTFSCYDPTEANLACGECDACLLRLKGFREAGLSDPIQY